ncbi:MAG: outer membrane lipoprotein chaperone LolA [Cardiobacteriaceae bacterium]|nr:outer membrane lipoprotein chaperone LolA [Cardiobacteriaceae bacterium]
MKKIFLLISAISSSYAFAQNFVISDDKPAANITQNTTNQGDISGLINYLSSTKSLQGKFTQEVQSAQGVESSQGEMKIAKPNKFYWDYQSPNKQKIISNGEKVWQYDIDLEQVSIRKRDELVGGAAMNVLSGANPEASFNITVADKSTLPSILNGVNADKFYRLTPKDTAESYDNIWLAMQAENIAAIAVDTGGNQYSLLTFSALKRNQNINPKDFEFTPPAGVDVAE